MEGVSVTPEPELSRAKRALIAQWRRGRAPNAQQVHPRPVSRFPGSAPLSFGQEQLWFFNQLEPNSPLYNIPFPMRLSGVLDQEALQAGFDTVVARHEILRTRFVGETQPVQIIDPPTPFPIERIDLRHLPKASRDAEAVRLMQEEVRRPFDLSKDLMMRARLIRTDVEEWILAVVIHHIASDVWSWRVICQELATIYPVHLSKQAPELASLPMQYADFALWQQQECSAKNLGEQLRYWREQLAAPPPVLNLPFDHPRPAVQSFKGAAEFLTLPASLRAKVEELAQREGATPYMVLLAAFQTLLFRYTGQKDMAIGTPTAGRTRVNFENLVGNFVNTLVLRGKIDGEAPFTELLRRSSETVLEALAHQDISFETLVKELRPERSSSYLPLVQVMFALQDELAGYFSLPKLNAAPMEPDTLTSKFDLTLTMIESGETLKCWAEYNTSLFERSTIQRMLGHYHKLLESIVAHPNQQISKLEFLTDSERTQLFEDWNKTQADYPAEKCVHELFLQQVTKSPDRLAVVFRDQSLTYQELNEQANQLAAHLRRVKAGPESMVAVCLDRSPDMVITLLAILKTGAAYLPIEPSRAVERIRLILDDSKAGILVTTQHWANVLGLQDIRSVCLDTERQQIASEPRDNLPNLAKPEDLAYVIYTSGSTGVPKGVQIGHRSVVNFLVSMRQRPGLTPDDVLVAVTPLSFDISGLELFLPLTVGARVVVADSETVLDPIRLGDLIESSKATVMQATPATWRMLLESGWHGSQRLRILCGGENLSRSLADKLLERSSEVWNLYGPTETTIWSTLCKVEPGPDPISIGKPIANTQVYVLDNWLNPLPHGIAGELFIGGDGLANGYLNRPELTAVRFIPNPFDTRSGARLYRTGDQVKFLGDGSLQFQGRLDYQVKIRGHRVELGEIETILGKCPGVQQAIVTLREDSTDNPMLTGYFVPEPGRRVSPSEIREFLEKKLPDYSVPSYFVPLERFPLTPSGKVDRKALPAPASRRPEVDGAVVAPNTSTEESLARIWCDVLELPSVGIHDNFFELGGHSLRMTQVISRIRQVFQVEVPFVQVFQSPTIAKLAAQIDGFRVNGVKDPITSRPEKRIIKSRKTMQQALDART
jgi:amino acid adenylation domain-containing protein